MEYLSESLVKRNLLPAFICAVLIVAVDDIKIYFFNDLAVWVDGRVWLLNIPLWLMIFLACAGLLHWRGLGLVSIEEQRALIRERNQLRQLLEGLRQSLGNDLSDIGSRNQVLVEGVIGAAQTTENASIKLIEGVNQVHADTRELLAQLQQTRDLALALLEHSSDKRLAAHDADADEMLTHINGIRSSILLIMQAFIGNTTQSQSFLHRIEEKLVDINSEFQFQDIVSQQLHTAAKMLGEVDAHFDAVAKFLSHPRLEQLGPHAYPGLRDMSDQLRFLCDLNENSRSRHAWDRSSSTAGAIELF